MQKDLIWVGSYCMRNESLVRKPGKPQQFLNYPGGNILCLSVKFNMYVTGLDISSAAEDNNTR